MITTPPSAFNTPMVYTALEDDALENFVFAVARWIVVDGANATSVPMWPLQRDSLFTDTCMTVLYSLNPEVAVVHFINRWPSLKSLIADRKPQSLRIARAASIHSTLIVCIPLNALRTRVGRAWRNWRAERHYNVRNPRSGIMAHLLAAMQTLRWPKWIRQRHVAVYDHTIKLFCRNQLVVVRELTDDIMANIRVVALF